MTVAMGAYEASLRERYLDAHRRLTRSPKPPVLLPVQAKREMPKPVSESRADKYRPIIKSISYVVEENSPFHWRQIIDEVCKKHDISKGNMMSRRRRQDLVAARFEAYYRLSEETTLSLPQIGRLMGGRDHTTVLYGIRIHQGRLAAQSTDLSTDEKPV